MRRALIAVSIGALALSACLPGTAEDSASEDAPVLDRITPPALEDAPQAVPPDDGEAREGVPGAACTDDEQMAIDGVIQQQLEAFAAEDFDVALGFATPGFRDRFTPDSFREVIQQGFPAVTRDATHLTRRCVTIGQEPAGAQALVTVTAADGERAHLVYLMANQDGRWLIGGATPVEPVGPDEDALTV